MIDTQRRTKADIFKKLDELKTLQVFDAALHPTIDRFIQTIKEYKEHGILGKEDIKEIQNYYGQEFLENTLQGMALLKKYGYAGDFLMIDKMYTGSRTLNPFYYSWDNYLQNQAAPKAVRNRKEYFKTVLLKKLEDKKELKLLNIASGPARDVAELFQCLGENKKLHVTCVEMDKHAISYAKEITQDFQEHIDFINQNIFKFDTNEKYDVIWSAGLFDYFENKDFKLILSKFKNWITDNGEIIIGNFNADHNPTRDYMEIIGDWYLHHRTDNELIQLGIDVGFNEENMQVNREAENVNLFLHINLQKI